MKIISLFALLLSLSKASFGFDDVYRNDSSAYLNVKVIDTTSNIVFTLSNGGIREWPRSSIQKILWSPFDTTKPSTYINSSQFLIASSYSEHTNSPMSSNQTSNEYPNRKFLFISVIAFGLAWDYFQTANNLSDAIETYKKLNIDYSFLENERARKSNLGFVFAAAGIVNMIVCLEPVEISAGKNSISLSYKFK